MWYTLASPHSGKLGLPSFRACIRMVEPGDEARCRHDAAYSDNVQHRSSMLSRPPSSHEWGEREKERERGREKEREREKGGVGRETPKQSAKQLPPDTRFSEAWNGDNDGQTNQLTRPNPENPLMSIYISAVNVLRIINSHHLRKY